MDPQDVLARRWYGNSLREWLVAALAFFIALLVLSVARRLLVKRLGAIAKRTTNDIDDLVVELVARTRWYFLALLAFDLARRFVTLPSKLDDALEKLVIVVVLLQIGRWGTGAIAFWVKRFRDKRIADADTASATTLEAVGYAGRAVMWSVVGAMALRAFGFDITALITGLGIGGVAIALAVQNILGDLFAALAIVLDKPFVIGDAINVEQYNGTVEHIGLKTTRLRSVTGEQIVIANGELLKGRIRNYKRMVERRVAFNVDAAYSTPPDAAERIPRMLEEIVRAQPGTRFDRSHFATYTDSALRFETVYYVLDPDYNHFMDIQQAVNLEVLRRFDSEGLEFAFPTRVTIAKGPGSAVRAQGKDEGAPTSE